ncbi:hypothetical protein [Flavobacterium sp. ASV13]|uniref:hypothetical protein n=1 Tax=Flavobacterium sp. ASV13 TaxID=1506583 RepID=UPI00054E4599|nr:hypothetical protein [Flavobacterium sp. ASV13]
MKKILLLTLFLYFSAINAQISFEKGYFISNDGTKTECFIKNIDWYNNPIDFKYKINLNDSDSKTETIKSITEFGIENNVTYKRASVKIDESSNKLDNLSTNKNPIWKDDTVFLKVLIKGDATLYQYVNGDMMRFFYETKERPLEQLVYKEYFIVNDNGGKTTDVNTFYKQQLYNNAKSETTTLNEIKKLEYKKEQLVKYFIKYNYLDANTVKQNSSNETKSIYLLKIMAGISSQSLSINSSQPSGYTNAKYDNKISPKFGIEGEYILPVNKNKWSIFMNLTYQKYEDSQEYGIITSINNGQTIQHPSEVEYTNLQMPIGLRHYLFLNDNSKIFINAAYVLNLSGKFTLKSSLINLESKSENNFALGLGYNYKNKLSAEVRANLKKNLLREYTVFKTDYSTIDLLFTYTIL